MPTVGQEEDERAFELWLASLSKSEIKSSISMLFSEAEVKFDLGAILRSAWTAGVQRGQELRGCCEERDA